MGKRGKFKKKKLKGIGKIVRLERSGKNKNKIVRLAGKGKKINK